MYKRAVVFVALIATACSSSSSDGAGDGGASDALDAIDSACGEPGDMGNSLGVGKFCNHLSDCSATPEAHLCSIIGDLPTHFCTKTCVGPADGGDDGGATVDAGDDGCGDGATCQCDSAGCGCTPNMCL